MKSQKEKFRHNLSVFLLDHIWLKYFLEYFIAFIICTISAILFAISVKVFLTPDVDNVTGIVSGGLSGISQIAGIIAQLFNKQITPETINLIYSVVYFILNIPLLYLSFRFIGIRFSIFTLLNVLEVSLLVNFVQMDFFKDLSKYVASVITVNEGGQTITYQTGLLARAIFAGACTGLSSAIAYKWEFSAGGFDILSYYFALRKSSNVGKYNMLLNSIVIISYSILTCVSKANMSGFNPFYIGECIALLLFSVIYEFTIALLIDAINIRNKKVQIQIITHEQNLSKVLLQNIPHGATVVKGKGAFSGNECYIIYVVVSSFEEKSVVELTRRLDPASFINVTNLAQVYGRFFIKPIK